MLKLGGKSIKSLFYGDKAVSKAYFGDNLIFSAMKKHTYELMNPDDSTGVINANGGNGWTIYQTNDYATVCNMLNNSLSSYDFWETRGQNAVAKIKAPASFVLGKYTQSQMWLSTASSRACSHWQIYGYNTEEDLLALTNGTLLDDNGWDAVASNMGETKEVILENNKSFQYYSIHAISNFQGWEYIYMGSLKLYKIA